MSKAGPNAYPARRAAGDRGYGPAFARMALTEGAVPRCDAAWYTFTVADRYTVRLTPGMRQKMTAALLPG
jgi:hypothetical protein